MPEDLNDLPYEPDYEEDVESHFEQKNLEDAQSYKDIKESEKS